MFKLIVLDVDGTLLGLDHQISPRVGVVIQRCMAIGCKVTLATGRFFIDVRHYAKRLKLTTPLILHSGALIQDSITRSIYFMDQFTPDELKRAIEVLIGMGYQPILYNSSGCGITGPIQNDPNPEISAFLTARGVKRVNQSVLVHQQETLGISIYTDDELIVHDQPVMADLGFKVLCNAPGVGHPLPWFELGVFPKQVSKGRALNKLISMLNLQPADVIAVGDNQNDLEMMAVAGFSVAMGNAIEVVKQAADAVVGTNKEDGVAMAIEKFILHTIK